MYPARTLNANVDILHEFNAGTASKFEIIKKYEVQRSTLSAYIRNRKTIEDAYDAEEFACDRKRLCSAEHPDLEETPIMQIKALKRAKRMPSTTFGHWDRLMTITFQ